MSKTKTVRNYVEEAREDAKEMARHFLREIVKQLVDEGIGEVSSDYNNDYPGGDSYHHENHIDQFYDLQEAAEILDQLSDYEETDSGLWRGLNPRNAISCQAAYTYGNAVRDFWFRIISEINSMSGPIEDALEDLENEVEGVTEDTIKGFVKEVIEQF